MGLMQKAVETYDAMEHLVGVMEEEKEPLAPIGHMCTKASIEITIDEEGHFVQARAIDQRIIIPVTEESSGRTSGAKAHPLCDQLDYVSGINEEKRELYLIQLNDWRKQADNRKLDAVYDYVRRGSMLQDLSQAGLVKFDNEHKLKNHKDMVCWRVVGLDLEGTALFADSELHKSYIDYYLQKISSGKKVISMISGETSTEAVQHLKGVFSRAGNAKIVSSNDNINFTYRGRFLDPEEALTISYIDSQKGHNALKWLITNQSVSFGDRGFICWNPQGIQIPKPTSPLFRSADETKKRTPSEYKSDLYKAVTGMKNRLPETAEVVITSFEAATSGRLAITYFNQLKGSDFLDRLRDWDETCCWFDNRWGTSAPGIPEIVRYAFGVQRGNEENSRVELDDRLMSQYVQQLLACRLEKRQFPISVMRAMVERTSRPESYNQRNRSRLLFNTCAVVRKYRKDRFKEEWDMALEPDKKDRSYQFGRLLAVLEKAERDTYDRDDKREPNAIRMQSVFVQRPGYASMIVINQVKNAYYPRLSPGQRVYYESLIGQIMQVISESGDSEYDKPLQETYILGYYLQKNEFYTKKEKESEENENE